MGSQRAWRFYHGLWEEIEDIVGLEKADNKYEQIKLAGYNVDKAITFGEVGSKFRIEIYAETLKAYYNDKSAKKPLYPYFISVSLIYQQKYIYVVDFPSLFLLLHQLYPMLTLQQADQLRQIVDSMEEQIESAKQTGSDEIIEGE
jgi:hypothetical protein